MTSLARFFVAALAVTALGEAPAQPSTADAPASAASPAPTTRAQVKADTRAAGKRGELAPAKVYDSAPFPPDTPHKPRAARSAASRASGR